MRRAWVHFVEYLGWYVILIFLILTILVWLAVFREDRGGVLTFTVLDIGQGDALFIESPTGIQVIVDGGPNRALMKEIPKVMPWYDRHVDMIVVTNPDKDHYEGFIPFLQKYRTKVFLEPGTQAGSESYDILEKLIEEKNIPKVLARRGQIIDIGGGAYFEIFFPDRDISGLSSNDGSIVMKLVYGETSIMLQGDSTEKIESYLISLDGSRLKSTILKTGHHGSKTSSSEEYIKKVDPGYAVISAGKNNSYGHPHEEVVATLANQKVETLTTCQNGKIVFESDGTNFILKNKNPKPIGISCKI